VYGAGKTKKSILVIPVELKIESKKVDQEIVHSIKTVLFNQLRQVKWVQLSKFFKVRFFLTGKTQKTKHDFLQQVPLRLEITAQVNEVLKKNQILIGDLSFKISRYGISQKKTYSTVELEDWPKFIENNLIPYLREKLQRPFYKLTIKLLGNKVLYKFKFSNEEETNYFFFNNHQSSEKIVFPFLPNSYRNLKVFYKGRLIRQQLLKSKKNVVINLKPRQGEKKLLVRSSPASNLFLNHEFVGKTPRSIWVSQGDLLELTLNGFKPIQKYILEKKITLLPVTFTLKKISLSSQQSLIDDTFLSYTFLGAGALITGLGIFFSTEIDRSKQFLFASLTATSFDALSGGELALYKKEIQYQQTMRTWSTVSFVTG